MAHDLRVELPADTSFIRLARMLVAGFAAECHPFDEARLAGLRLAVSEVCAHALTSHAAAGGEGPIGVRARSTPGRLEVWIDGRSRGSGPVGEPGGDRMPLAVADALVDGLDSRWVDDREIVHLTVDERAEP